MTKKVAVLLSLWSFTIGTGIASGVEIQTAPVEQNTLSAVAETKQSATIGPRDPEKEKPHGIGVDVFLSKNVAMTSSVSLLPAAPSVLPGSSGQGLNAAQLGGTVGLKMIFN